MKIIRLKGTEQNKSGKSGRKDYPSQGFTVHWSEKGLAIEVTDYHPEVLRLPWDTLREFAEKAGIDLGTTGEQT